MTHARSLIEQVRRLAVERPDGIAFVTAGRRMTWHQYDALSDRLACAFSSAGVTRQDRLAVLMADGPEVHATYLAARKLGAVVVGLGPRAGDQEIAHLLRTTGPTTLATASTHRGSSADDLVARLRSTGAPLHRHLVVPDFPGCLTQPVLVDGEPAVGAMNGWRPDLPPRAADDLFFLNSTSGTTGLPKCVMHSEARWLEFHELARDAGALGDDDCFVSLIPAPYGFGLWTAHFTPTLLGATTAVMPRFSADGALDVIEQERATVLCCVSTQFIMMLNACDAADRDLSSLRVMFTGGEAVPFERAAEFERRTGARVLQFYGSNETGALSRTTLQDPQDKRLRTAGRVIPSMNVRVYDDDGAEITSAVRVGQPACRGPVTCLAYWNDDEANDALFTADGWMLTGDIVEIDEEGYLRVVGRKSDFIIRGGKNISAAAVEEHVATHPAVALAAAIAMPDAVFGERVCAYVTLRPGGELSIEDLTAHLSGRGISKESFPERLIALPELPRASGGKIAKARLRADIRRRLAEEAAARDS